MKRLKVVQIGIGHDHAIWAWGSLKKQTDIFDVIGWCPIDDEGERPAIKYYPAEERLTLEEVLMRDDIDAVFIETDDWNLTNYAQIFVERGIAVHMDKPGSVSQEDFEKLACTVRDKQVAFQLGYMYRFNPMIMEVVKNARNGVYGNINTVEIQMSCEHSKAKRDWLAHFKGGMLYFLGCHLIDLIIQIKGIPADIIPLSYRSGYDDAKGEDVGLAIFKYPNCVAFAKTSGVEPGGFMRRQLVITGKACNIELRPLEDFSPGPENVITKMRFSEPGKGWTSDGEYYNSEPHDRYDNMFAFFAAIVRGEKENPYSLEYECQLHRVILAACGHEIDYKTPVKL